MGRFTKKDMPMWAKTGHRKPVTRREFLSHGMIPFAASALVPGALGLLSPDVMAAGLNCPSDAGAGIAAFITLNLSGGASLSSNFLPRDAGGQLLASYGKIGGGTNANLTTAADFGIQGFVSTSPLLAGLKTKATQPTIDGTAVVSVCVQSRDDSAENKFDASGMAYKAGVMGSKIPNLGTRSNATGLSQLASTVQPPPPLIVRSFDDLANSIGYTAALKNQLNSAQRVSLTRLVASLNSTQTNKLQNITTAEQVQTMVECAGIKNNDMIGAGSGAVDPLTNNAAMASVWGITAGTAANNQGRVFGSMVYNALAGNAGTVNLELGGYDYHDNTRTNGDGKDNQAGVVIGQILESARIMGKPVFIYVTSDGSVVSSDSATPGAPWTSDRGSAGMALMFAFSPTGRPATSGFQVGSYTSGQVANDATPVGSSPEVAAQAVIANYLNFIKRASMFPAVAPSSPLSGGALQGVLKLV